jgi:hypothetical protein
MIADRSRDKNRFQSAPHQSKDEFDIFSAPRVLIFDVVEAVVGRYNDSDTVQAIIDHIRAVLSKKRVRLKSYDSMRGAFEP